MNSVLNSHSVVTVAQRLWPDTSGLMKSLMHACFIQVAVNYYAACMTFPSGLQHSYLDSMVHDKSANNAH